MRCAPIVRAPVLALGAVRLTPTDDLLWAWNAYFPFPPWVGAAALAVLWLVRRAMRKSAGVSGAGVSGGVVLAIALIMLYAFFRVTGML